jgi:hypothetical protein
VRTDSLAEGEGSEPSVPQMGRSRKAGLRIAANALLENHRTRLSSSYLDLGAEVDDAVRRGAEEFRWLRRDAHEAGIKAQAPSYHPEPRARFDVSAHDENESWGALADDDEIGTTTGDICTPPKLNPPVHRPKLFLAHGYE